MLVNLVTTKNLWYLLLLLPMISQTQPNKHDDWTMCVTYLNIHSIVNKINIFQSFVYSRFPVVIGVTETWLSDKLFENEILSHNYSIIQKDRQSRGSGVMFTIKYSKSYQVLPSPSDLEILTIIVLDQLLLLFIV